MNYIMPHDAPATNMNMFFGCCYNGGLKYPEEVQLGMFHK